jgi:hypothetical protein
VCVPYRGFGAGCRLSGRHGPCCEPVSLAARFVFTAGDLVCGDHRTSKSGCLADFTAKLGTIEQRWLGFCAVQRVTHIANTRNNQLCAGRPCAADGIGRCQAPPVPTEPEIVLRAVPLRLPVETL